MDWIAGIDLLEWSRGAMCFAAWIRERAGGRLTGVHVIETTPYALDDDAETSPQFGKWVLQKTREHASSVGVESAFDAFDAIEASAPEDGLTAAVDQGRGDIIVIGRRAARNETRLIRLGRVARRLTRTLPAPILVVPPDLTRASIGDGPVVVGVGLADDCLAAVGFGRAMAAALEREFVVVHVVPPPRSVERYLPEQSRAGRDEHIARAREAADAWVARHEITDATVGVIEGRTAAALRQIAEREEACLLVVGSRRLSAVERLYRSSVGVALAATSSTAVAIVPPR